MSKNQDEQLKNQCKCKCECDCESTQSNDEEIVVSLCDEDESELIKEKRRADEMTYQAQRIQAEFDNYRRRNAEMTARIKEEGKTEVIKMIIPALDAFNKATKLITDQSTLKGINLIYDMLFSSLSQMGFEKIEPLNQEFDPNIHEAVMTREDNASTGTVIEVLQDGYILNGKVLRAAMVVTAS